MKHPSTTMIMTSSNPNASTDHALARLVPFTFNFDSWTALLSQDSLSTPNQGSFLQGLQYYPEWLNRTNQRQQTPLIIAAEHGHVTMVQTLIQAGARVNLQDEDGWTALMHASHQGHLEVVQALIQAGASLNDRDDYGWTALMRASYKGYIDIVKLLIQNGSDLNVQNKAGWTALMLASYFCHPQVVKQLIQAGADLNLQDTNGRTALIHASYEAHNDDRTEIVKTLIQAGADLNLQDQNGWTALIHALHQAHTDGYTLVKTLIQADANLNLQDQKGLTALMWAVDCRHVALVQSLLHQGADLNVLNDDHRTALDIARRKGQEDVIRLLEAQSSQQTLNQVINPLDSSSSQKRFALLASSKTPRL